MQLPFQIFSKVYTIIGAPSSVLSCNFQLDEISQMAPYSLSITWTIFKQGYSCHRWKYDIYVPLNSSHYFMTPAPPKRATNLHKIPKCRVLHLDPLRYLKLHEDGLLPVDHAYRKAQKHTLFQHDYWINCHLLSSSRRGKISMAKPLELVNHKTCHGSIHLTEISKPQPPLWNRCKLFIPLWWMRPGWYSG